MLFGIKTSKAIAAEREKAAREARIARAERKAAKNTRRSREACSPSVDWGSIAVFLLLEELARMSEQLTKLTDAVARNEVAVASVVAKIEELKQGSDDVVLAELATRVEASAQALEDAIAEPTEEPTDPTDPTDPTV